MVANDGMMVVLIVFEAKKGGNEGFERNQKWSHNGYLTATNASSSALLFSVTI
jgi:hypothetical protein